MIAKRGTAMWMRAATIFALAWAGAGSLAPVRVATAAASVVSVPDTAQAALCFNLDLVFIIDQSQSMSQFQYVKDESGKIREDENGEKILVAGPSANDPDKQRITAAVEMSRVLSDISLDECPGALHRMAVVSFGTEAKLDLPLTEIRPDTLKIVEEQITSADYDMGQTDPDRGFDMAAKELDQAASVGDGPRKRVIVLLTDGEPCVATLGCTGPGGTMQPLVYIKKTQERLLEDLPFDAQLLKQDACIAGLVKKYGDRDKVPASERDGCLKTYPIREAKAYGDSTYIFTLLLRPKVRYTDPVKDVMRQISTEHGGELVELTQNAVDIPVMLRKIVSRLAGVKVTQLQCGNFAVNPYLKKMTLAISRISPDTKVTISYRDAGGKQYKITGGNALDGGFVAPAGVKIHTPNGVNERYVFANPYPGIWNLAAVDCNKFQAFYDPLDISAISSGGGGNQDRLLQMDEAPYFDPARPYKLAYEMLDELGEVVAEAEPEPFAVKGVLLVTQPNNVTIPYPMGYVRGKFETTEPIRLPLPGKYKYEYSGTTHYRAELFSLGGTTDLTLAFPDEQQLFKGSGSFEVLPVSQFRVVIVEPKPDEDLSPVHRPLYEGWQWPLQITEFKVRAQLVRKDGGVLANLSEVLKPPGATLTLFVGSGSEGVVMTRVGETAEFKAKIEGYATLGASTVTVLFAGSATDTYRPEVTVKEGDACAAATLNGQVQDRTCASVGIIRNDTWWTTPSNYLRMLWALAALALICMGFIIRGRMDPVRGRLVFGVGADIYQERSVFTRNRTSRLSLKGSPELLLREVRVWYLPVRTAHVEDGEHPPERGVRLKVTNRRGQSVKLDLMPNEEVRYLNQFPMAARPAADPEAGDDASQLYMRFEAD